MIRKGIREISVKETAPSNIVRETRAHSFYRRAAVEEVHGEPQNHMYHRLSSVSLDVLGSYEEAIRHVIRTGPTDAKQNQSIKRQAELEGLGIRALAGGSGNSWWKQDCREARKEYKPSDKTEEDRLEEALESH